MCCTHSGTQRGVCALGPDGIVSTFVHTRASKQNVSSHAGENPESGCDHQCLSSPRLASISFGASVSAWGKHRKQVDTACFSPLANHNARAVCTKLDGMRVIISSKDCSGAAG